MFESKNKKIVLSELKNWNRDNRGLSQNQGHWPSNKNHDSTTLKLKDKKIQQSQHIITENKLSKKKQQKGIHSMSKSILKINLEF